MSSWALVHRLIPDVQTIRLEWDKHKIQNLTNLENVRLNLKIISMIVDKLLEGSLPSELPTLNYKLPPCTYLLGKNGIYTLDSDLKDLSIKHTFLKDPLITWEDFEKLLYRDMNPREVWTIETEILLQSSGYRSWLDGRSHSISHLETYYANDPSRLEWYILPHLCRPWNEIALYLACLSEPDEKWILIDDEGETDEGDHAHSTVVNNSRSRCFDLTGSFEVIAKACFDHHLSCDYQTVK